MQAERTKGNLKCVASGTEAEVFKQFAAFDSTFQDTKCGKCNTENISFQVREVDSNEFYELQCNNRECRARLSFGHSKENKGAIYPKRFQTDNKGKTVKRDDGRSVYLPNNGWTIYEPKKDD